MPNRTRRRLLCLGAAGAALAAPLMWAMAPPPANASLDSLARAMGSPEAVIDLAFHATREQLPDTELVYNDYMGWEPDSGAHRNGVLRLHEHFRRADVPVDALGIQAHIGSGNQDNNASRAFDSRDERAWRRFLDEVAALRTAPPR